MDGAYAWVDTTPAELTNSADDILKSYIGVSGTRSSVVIRFGTDGSATGDTFYEGTAWLTAFSVSAPTEDTATYSLSFTGTGALTVTVA